MKALRIVLLVLILIGIYLGKGVYLSDKNIPEELSSTPTLTSQENPFICPYDELNLYPTFGETVNNLIKNDCLHATVTKLSDNKTLIYGVGYGCGSCHAKTLYLVKNDKVIFKYLGDDSNFSEVRGGFQIEEPVRKDGEPMCCATEYVIKKYQYIEAQNIVKEL